MLDAASKGDIVIFTSTLSKVEVAFGATEQQAGALDPAVEARIDELWSTGSPVKLVEFHELLAQDARGLIRRAIAKGWSLKPADAIHLATAMRHRATVCHTYDPGMPKFASEIGIPIEEPIATAPMLALRDAEPRPES